MLQAAVLSEQNHRPDLRSAILDVSARQTVSVLIRPNVSVGLVMH